LKPTRPLSLKDLEYLHITKFSGRPYVSQVRPSPFALKIRCLIIFLIGGLRFLLGMVRYHLVQNQESSKAHLADVDQRTDLWVPFTRGFRPVAANTGSHSRLLLGEVLRSLRRSVCGCICQSGQKGEFSPPPLFPHFNIYLKEDPNGREVKHYLVRPEDIEKKSTLPDFLRECENLWYLLQVVRDPESGVISLRPRNKDEVMAPYYTRERSQPLPYGYDTRQP